VCVPGQQARPAAAAPRNAGEALAALRWGLGYLATAKSTALTTAERAECLRELERAESVRIAARSSVLSAFDESGGHREDGQGSARSWLRWQARITGAAAGAAAAWARRLAAHPAVHAALGQGVVSPSWARAICDWSDLLPESLRPDADAILLAAAAAGAELADLAGLAEEMRARTARPDRDDGGDGGFGDRSLRLDLHYRGAGKLSGDLTPRCAAALQAVLEALGKKAGPEDARTRAQRDHDALEEACRRLIAARNLPERAGQPTRIQLVMTLDQLLGLQPGSTGGPGCGPADADSRAGSREVARRALFPHRGDLTRPQPAGWTGPGPLATPGDLCDASIVPVVTGHVDHELLNRLIGDLLGGGRQPASPSPGGPQPGGAEPGGAEPGSAEPAGGQAGAPAGTLAGRLTASYLRDLIVRHAVSLLSGPSGLASRLRAGTLTGPATAISLPLDVGTATETIPSYLRSAVILRDQHCGFPGCTQPPSACQVHHLIPRSEGGTTSLDNCGLYCLFHHLVVIHQWGWKIISHPDGTKTAISPDGTKTLHSHDPPQAA